MLIYHPESHQTPLKVPVFCLRGTTGTARYMSLHPTDHFVYDLDALRLGLEATKTIKAMKAYLKDHWSDFMIPASQFAGYAYGPGSTVRPDAKTDWRKIVGVSRSALVPAGVIEPPNFPSSAKLSVAMEELVYDPLEGLVIASRANPYIHASRHGGRYLGCPIDASLEGLHQVLGEGIIVGPKLHLDDMYVTSELDMGRLDSTLRDAMLQRIREHLSMYYGWEIDSLMPVTMTLKYPSSEVNQNNKHGVFTDEEWAAHVSKGEFTVYNGPAWQLRVSLQGHRAKCNIYVKDNCDFIVSSWCFREHNQQQHGWEQYTGKTVKHTLLTWLAGPCEDHMGIGKFGDSAQVSIMETTLLEAMKPLLTLPLAKKVQLWSVLPSSPLIYGNEGFVTYYHAAPGQHHSHGFRFDEGWFHPIVGPHFLTGPFSEELGVIRDENVPIVKTIVKTCPEAFLTWVSHLPLHEVHG